MVGNLRIQPEDRAITHISVQKDASLSEISGSVHDIMRYGWRNVEAGSRKTHPVQSIQDNWQETEDQLHLDLLKYAFGTHMPLRLQMERAIVKQVNFMCQQKDQ
jgi:proteasome maturation protein